MQSQPPAPKFDPSQTHQNTPKLRAVRGFPVQLQNGQQAMGLADARQISDRMVVAAPAFQVILPLMDGTRTAQQIVAEIGRGLTLEILGPFIAQLDDAGLLFGPRFDALMAKVRADFDSSPTLPPAATAQFADALASQTLAEAFEKATQDEKDKVAAEKLPELFDQWITQSLQDQSAPPIESLPKAIVAPHLDYPRGWLNYAAIYGRLRGLPSPDRVVILGTNHFGEGTGVVACDKGYQTVLGTCKADRALIDALRAKLGETPFASRYDHEREHSIELHIPWIQHVFGKNDKGEFPAVFGALIHDPAVNNGDSYDGNGQSLDAFVDALREALAALPGRTLVISSADLSHVGQAFGDEGTLAGETPEAQQMRNNTFNHDREMLELVAQRKPDELVAAMAWQRNPTRWCSVGNLVATLKLVQPERVDLLNYAGAMDEQGITLVTSAALAMH